MARGYLSTNDRKRNLCVVVQFQNGHAKQIVTAAGKPAVIGLETGIGVRIIIHGHPPRILLKSGLRKIPFFLLKQQVR